MKKWQKRSLAAVLAVLMAFSCAAFGMTVFAEYEEVEPAGFGYDGSVQWEYEEDGEVYNGFETIPALKSAEFAKKTYAYTGSAIKPKLIVMDTCNSTVNKDYYDVTYDNRVAVGTSTATVKFKDLYEGTVKRSFKIVPAKMAAPTVVNAAKGFKITWTKAKGGVTGYEIWRSKAGAAYQKVKVIADASTTTYTDSSDAANANGVKYAYKIRAYKKGHSYGAFSAAKVSYKVARPAAPTVKNSGSGKISVSWAKNAKASGYKVKYVTGSTTKIAEVKGADMTGITLTVNKKAKYSVYVQAYKTVSGKTYHSCFSPAKTITTT